MKTGILTFHRADNYGAVLQAVALQEKFMQKKCEAEIIDYRCGIIEKSYLNRPAPKIRKNILAWLREIFIWIRLCQKNNLRRERFEQFRSNLRMSCPVSDLNQKKEIEDSYDLIITGSDQVWNFNITKEIDKWYCFEKTNNSGKTIVASYAASVGSVDDFSKYFPMVNDIINSYDYISVRESDAQEYLSKKTNKPVKLVLDPTLLIDFSFWDSLFKTESIINLPYVFYYDASSNDSARKIASKLAKRKCIRLIHFNPNILPKFKTRFAYESGPSEFLNLIKNAEYVVTSSFHATVFSIIFKKKFITVSHPVTGARVKTLLHELGLDDRIVQTNSKFEDNKIEKEPDYDVAYNNLLKLKRESNEFIDECIEAVKKI